MRATRFPCRLTPVDTGPTWPLYLRGEGEGWKRGEKPSRVLFTALRSGSAALCRRHPSC